MHANTLTSCDDLCAELLPPVDNNNLDETFLKHSDQCVECATSTITSATSSCTASLSADENEKDDLSIVLEPLKICYVVEPSPLTYFCGYAPLFQALFKHVLRHHPKDELELITSDCVKGKPISWPAKEEVAPRDMKVHYTFGIPNFLYSAYTHPVDLTQKLGRMLFQSRPDLIHASFPSTFDVPNIVYSRLFGIPLFLSYHTHLPLVHRYFVNGEKWSKSKSLLAPIMLLIIELCEYFCWLYLKLGYYFADLMVVVSPEIQEEFRQHGMDDVEVWQKGIDTERFSPDHYNTNMRERMTGGRTDDPFLLVHFGRFGAEKRIHHLKTIMDKLPPDVHLCLVGSGPIEDSLRDLFLNDESTANRTTFTGYMDGVELSQAFASGDVFAMPSDFETLGCVVLESLASGVPVVGVAAGGVKGLIDDGVTGFLYENGDLDQMLDKIRLLYEDRALRKSMSEAARNEMLKWSWTASIMKMREEHYVQCRVNFQKRFDTRVRNWIYNFCTSADYTHCTKGKIE